MHIHPLFVDSRPEYLSQAGPSASLLLMPLGTQTLLEHLQSRLADVCDRPPVVYATFATGPEYTAALQRVCPGATVVCASDLTTHLARCESADWLFILDARRYPADGLEPATLLGEASMDPRWVRHLVDLESTVHGTTERLEEDVDGRVRRIERHYENVTWPFVAGVIASLMPVSCRALSGGIAFSSLAELRVTLATHGVPSHDLPLRGRALDLSQPADFLDFAERFTLDAFDSDDVVDNGPLLVGSGHRIDPGARIVGPVILHAGTRVHDGAVLVGPTVLGRDVEVGAGATLAQSIAVSGARCAPFSISRQAVLASGQAAFALDSEAGDDEACDFESGAEVTYREPMRRLFAPGAEGHVRAKYLLVKRLLESAAAMLLLLLLSPLLLLLAVLIKLESRGPALFGHKREGLGGRVFHCWKFRTMYVGAEQRQRELAEKNEMDGPQFKLVNDPRVTRLGRWLRPLSLDELPQLINVALGQMSFVGPRPSPFRENQLCVAWREGRLSIRPGITGLWQVCRHDRALGDFHQWIEYDLLYVRHLSFWVDVKIALATVITLGGKGHVPVSWILSRRHLQPAA
jgi:lipopolysaccharide/colanic/teichoic acid biosynthesis glycosyltransferase